MFRFIFIVFVIAVVAYLLLRKDKNGDDKNTKITGKRKSGSDRFDNAGDDLH